MSFGSKLSIAFIAATLGVIGTLVHERGVPAWPNKGGPAEETAYEEEVKPVTAKPADDKNDDFIPDDTALQVVEEPSEEEEIEDSPTPPEPPAPDPGSAFGLSACSALAQSHDTKTLTDPARLRDMNGAYFNKSRTLFLTTEDGKNGCAYNMRDKKFPIPVAAFNLETQGSDYYTAMQKALGPKVIVNGSNPAPGFNLAACAALSRDNSLYERLNENKGKNRNDFLRSNDGQIFDKEQVFFVVLPEAPAKTACAYAYDKNNQHVPLAWFDMSSTDGAKAYYAERDRMSNSKTRRNNPSAEKSKTDAAMKFLKRHHGY